MVNDNIERFDVAMHDSVNVRVLERLKDHVSVQPDIHAVEFSSEYFGLNVGDVLENEGGSLCRRVTQDVVHLYDVGPSVECLKDLHLSILLLDANRFENFNDTLLVIGKICPFEDLAVFAAAELMVAIIVV